MNTEVETYVYAFVELALVSVYRVKDCGIVCASLVPWWAAMYYEAAIKSFYKI